MILRLRRVPTIRKLQRFGMVIFTEVRHVQEKVGYRVGWHLNPDGTSVGTSQPTWRVLRVLATVLRLGYFFNRNLGYFLPELSTSHAFLTCGPRVVESSATFLTT